MVLAGVAGGCAVCGAWEAIAAVEEAAPARVLGRLAAPLHAVAREGREPSTAERRRLALIGAATLLAGGWLVGGAPVGIALAAAGPWAVASLLRARRDRWRAELAAGAATAARALADALAGGHSIRGAVESVAAAGGLGAATGAELRVCASALALGERTDAVLERLRARAGHPAYDAIVAAMLLQRDAGGPLASLLTDLAGELDETRRVEADARAATAQARYTSWLVAALPVGATALTEMGRPGTLAEISSSALTAWLGIAGVLCQVAALAVIARLARVGERV
jgi:tight adherence protein B